MKKIGFALICLVLSVCVAVIVPRPLLSRPFVDSTFCMNAACHVLSELQFQHQGECTICHTEPEPQTVYAAVCSQCHPINNPTRCDLIRLHDDVPPDPAPENTVNGLYCIDCHLNCQASVPEPCGIDVLQKQIVQSRWFPLPALITIVGTETGFTQLGTQVQLTSDQSPGSLIKLASLVIPSAQVIQQLVLVLPSGRTDDGSDGESETITVKVTNGGCDVAVDSIQIKPLAVPEDK